MEITTLKKPIFGKTDYPRWIQIPHTPGQGDPFTQGWLSVSKHSNLELKPDNEDSFVLVFPIGRYITITPTQNNRNQKVWITRYNEEDVRKESEQPTKNPDDDLR